MRFRITNKIKVQSECLFTHGLKHRLDFLFRLNHLKTGYPKSYPSQDRALSRSVIASLIFLKRR